MNSLIGVIFSSISKAPVGVLENAEEIMRHASVCTFEIFFARYFLFASPTQGVHAYVMTGCINAVYIHLMLIGFSHHALPSIFLHCNNATVALRAICIM